MIIPVILSGGSSTRLWPLSQVDLPKQFLAMTSERTMLQETALRFAGRDGFGAPMIICHEDHRFVAAEQLRQIGCAAQAIILEPAGRNTAPAAALAALLTERAGPDDIMVLLPADHLIADVPALHQAIAAAVPAADAGRLVTLGIKPDRPHTGYGYIRVGGALADHAGCHAIDRFVEKPDRERAAAFVESGGYLWNGGMFVMRAGAFLTELRKWEPDVHESCRSALDAAATDPDFLRPDRQVFERCKAISIDHAVMERTEAGAVVPVEMGWHDIGSWATLWEVLERSAEGNVVSGPVSAVDTRASYLRSEGPALAVIGLERCIVVATDDAVLVCPMDRAEDVKLVADLLDGGASTTDRHHPGSPPDGTKA